jgi:hypothetical protein
MADNDLNIIRAVEGLQNIQGLTPTEQRQKRKRRQQTGGHSAQEPQDELADETADPGTAGSEDDPHSIDYCA